MLSNKVFLLSVAWMLAALALVAFFSLRPKPRVIRTNLENLPMEIADRRGREDSFPESVYRELNADKNLYRHYRAADGSNLDLYIGYYGTAKGGRTGHNPYACLPGAGWAIVDSERINLGPPSQSRNVAVNYVLARRNGVNTVMLHWYQSGSAVLSSGLMQNTERFLGRIARNRNDGAFVQITSQVSDDEVEIAKKEAGAFAGQVIRLLPGYWPVEQ